MSDTRIALHDSQLFTQVEPDWLTDSQGRTTFVNTSRGVVAVVEHSNPHTARIFHDRLGMTYASTGWYDSEELGKWWFPVMRSDRAWNQYVKQTDNQDITEVLDLI
jgi:hypothetical protein